MKHQVSGWMAGMVVVGLGLLAVGAQADSLTWDSTVGGAINDGAGTWLGAGQWNNGSPSITWNNATPDNATIGNTGGGGVITLGTVNAGSVTFGSFTGTYTLNGGILTQSGGISVGAGSAAITIGSVLSGSGGITKNGAGTLTLSGNPNQFTGSTIISNGKVALGAQYALWQSAYDTTGSTGAIGLNSTGQATPWLGGLAGSVDLATAITGYSAITSLRLNPQTGSSVSYGGVIANGSGNMALNKTGHGTQTLTSSNTYSGATTVWAGTLGLGGVAGSVLNSAFTVKGGTLLLDNSGGTWIDRLADATALSLGSLTLKSDNGGSPQTETVGATTLATSGKITIDNGTGAGTTLAVNGTVTRAANSGVAIDFASAGGTLGGGAGNPNVTATTLPANANGILPWATVNGTQWAENNANSVRAYSGGFVNPVDDASAATSNAQFTGSGTMGSAKSFNSLNVIASGAGQSLGLGGILTLTSPGAILKSGSDSYSITGSVANAITAGAELIAHVDGGALTISAPLNTAIVNIAKGGTGDLILSGTRAGTMSGAISIAGGQLEFRGSSTTLSGVITGVGGLTINLNAGQTLTINNNSNSYAGPTIVKGGYFSGAGYPTAGLPGGLNQTPGTNPSQIMSNLKLEGGVFYATYTFNKDLGAGPGQVQVLAGTSGFVNTANQGGAAGFVLDGGREIVWGSTYFNPTVFVHSLNNGANLTLNLANGFDLNGSTRTILVGDATYNASAAGASQLGGVIRTSSGTAGLTKTGIGTLVLSGANTFNGQLTVDNGALSIGSINNVSVNGVLGNSALPVILGASGNTGTLKYTGGTTSSTKPFTMATGGTGAFDVSTAATILTLSGQIDGDGGLSKVGAGTLALTGTNTYTGATTINGGTLAVNTPGSLAAGSAVVVNSGGTVAGSGTYDGTVTINSGGTVAGSGTYNGTVTINSGGTVAGSGTYNGTVTVSSNATLSATTVTYNGLVTGVAGTAHFSPGGLGTIATLSPGNGLTLNAGNGVNCDLGTVSGSSDLIAITGDLDLQGTSYVAFNVPTGSAASNATYTIMTWTGSQTGGGTLVFPDGTTTMNGATLNIYANSVTITTGAGGITTGSRNVIWKGTSSYVWDSSTVNWDVSGTPTAYAYGDNVTFDDSGLAVSPVTGTPANPGSVTFSSSAKNYTLAASIGGSGALTKTGSGTLIITGANSFSGGIFLNQGTLQLNNNSSASLGDPANVLTFTGSSTISDGLRTYPTLSQGFVVNEGVTATLTGGHPSGITINNSLTGSGTLNIRGGGDFVCDIWGTSSTFSGDITLGASSAGYAGTLKMNSLADASGRRVKMGETDRYGAFTYGTGAVVPLVLSQRQIELTGTTAGGTFKNDASGANTVTINTDLLVTVAGNKTFTLGGSNTGNNTFAGVITNRTSAVISLTKADAGKWIVSGNNTFTGAVTLNGGTLVLSGTNSYTGSTLIGNGQSSATLSVSSVSDYGVASAIGAAASGSISLNPNAGGTAVFVFTGTGGSMNRQFHMSRSDTTVMTGAIINNGSGALVLTASAFNSPLGSGSAQTRAFRLGGTYAGGTNEIRGVIADNSTATGSLIALTKDADASIWKLSGANTFTGSTAVNGGKLILDFDTQDNSKLAIGVALTLGGGTLELSGGSHTQIVASVTLTAGTASRITRTSGSAKIQLGAITRGAGATLDISAENIATTSTGNDANGVLPGVTINGSNFARNDGSGNIVAYGSYTDVQRLTPGTIPNTATANVRLVEGSGSAGNITLAAGTNTINTLLQSTEGGTSAATILTTGQILGVNSILCAAGSGPLTIATAPGAGTLRTATASGNLLVMNHSASTLTLNSYIANNTGASTLSHEGSGTTVLAAGNGYTGATTIRSGVLRIQWIDSLGTVAAGTTVASGAALELQGTFTTLAEPLALNGTGVSNDGALRHISGSPTFAGPITIASASRINSDSGTLTLTNTLATTANNHATIGGSGNTTISGVISGAGNLIKDGSGTLTLSGAGANTLSGETQVNSGTLLIASTALNAIANTSTLRIASGAILELGSGVNETVGVFYLGGQPASPGTWGSLSSDADNKDSVYFKGTGVITVTQLGSGTPYEAKGPSGTVLIVK